MYSVVIGHPNVFDENPLKNQIITIGGYDISFGLIESEIPQFNLELNPYKILLKKIAFSCGYRDIAMCGIIYDSCLNNSKNDNYVCSGFGSEFVGEIIAVGNKVSNLNIGDKVVPNCAYPEKRLRSNQGIPTSFSSEFYSILDEEQLIKIPPNFDVKMAAAVSITGQTVYSIIRRADIKMGQSVIIAAASSNTSLFAMETLKNSDLNIIGITSSYDKINVLKKLGYTDVVISPQIDPLPLQNLTRQFGGFDLVIDPFSDLYLNRIIDYMNLFSKYFTCGVYRQNKAMYKTDMENVELGLDFINKMIAKNVSIIGNCLGSTKDLENAINDIMEGHTKIIIDSIFTGDKYGDFLKKSFSGKNRLGKVVYIY